MGGFDVALAADVAVLSAGTLPMQTGDPAVLSEASGAVRGSLAFSIVLLFGGALVWRFEPFLERSIDSSRAKPLRSLLYGVAAHAAIAFAGVYLTSRLAQIRVSGWSAGGVGVLVGLLLFFLAAALGFTVVGATVVELGWEPRRWTGVVVGAIIAGGIAVIDPLVGGAVWFVLVSMGIGGPVRAWFTASAADT